jgi:hypothetical protein
MEMKNLADEKVFIKKMVVFSQLSDGTYREILIDKEIIKAMMDSCKGEDGISHFFGSSTVSHIFSTYKPLNWQQLPGYIWLADGPYFAFQIDFCEDGWSESDDNYMYMAMRNYADEPDCEYFLTLEEAKAHCDKLYREDMDRFVKFLI